MLVLNSIYIGANFVKHNWIEMSLWSLWAILIIYVLVSLIKKLGKPISEYEKGIIKEALSTYS
jgi:hypothetical protein